MKNVNPSTLVQRVFKVAHAALAPLGSRAHDVPAAAIAAGSEVQDQHIDAAYTQHLHRKTLQTLGCATVDEVKESWERKTLVLVDSKLPLPTGEDFAQRVFHQMGENNRILQEAFQAQMVQIQDGTKQNTEAIQATNALLKAQVQDLQAQMAQNTSAIQAQMVQNTSAIQAQMVQKTSAIQAQMVQIQDGTKQNTDAIQATNALLTQVAIQTAKNANRALMRLETLVPVPNNQGVIPDGIAFPQTYEHLMNMGVRDLNRLLDFYGILPEKGVGLDQRKELLCRHLGFLHNRD